MSSEEITVTLNRAEMAARGRVGGLVTASRYDMSAIARRAREGLAKKFLDQAGGDPVKADVLRRLYYARLTERRLATLRGKKAS